MEGTRGLPFGVKGEIAMGYMKTMLSIANPTADIEGKTGHLISPIPRAYTANKEPVYETNPSCGYAIMDDLTEVIKDFTDEAGKGYSEVSLVQELEKLDSVNARKVVHNYKMADTLLAEGVTQNWKYISKEWISSKEGMLIAEQYGFTQKVLEELQVAQLNGTTFTVPIINNDVILGIGKYHPNLENKWDYTAGTKGSLIVGFDQWVYNYEQPTLICEGQKDMMIARSKGYNAICFTGGARAIPELYVKYFEGRECHIVFDNDNTGREGARKLAVWLHEHKAKSIKIVDGFHKDLPEKGDIWDYFQALKHTKKQLDKIIAETKDFERDDYENAVKEIYPVITLKQAVEKEWIGKMVQTDLLVVSEWNQSWLLPEDVTLDVENDEGVLTQYEYTVEYKRAFLNLAQSEKSQMSYITSGATKTLADGTVVHIPDKKHKVVKKRIKSRQTMYGVQVEAITNNWEAGKQENNLNLTAYCFGKKPITGKKYRFRYRMAAHPMTSVMVMIVEEFLPIDEGKETFKISQDTINEMKQAFNVETTSSVENKFNELYMDMKGYIGPRLNRHLWLATDLCFNSVLKYVWHSKLKRGTLDIAIIGDAGFGKSYTFDHLQRLYKSGYKVSSENATVISIIGGTTTRNQIRQTTVGILGQQDGGLVCFEEATRLGPELMANLNQIRSEGKASISRVDGNLNYTAELRYCIVANQKEEGTTNMIYNTNGLLPIKSLFPKPEHRRRFDYVLTTGSTDPLRINSSSRNLIKNYTPQLKHRPELYFNRLKWIWSRSPEDIVFAKGVEDKAYACFDDWYKRYWTGESLFGMSEEEFVDKIVRIGIAVAGMTFNTDDKGEKLYVNEEHILYAYNKFWREIYESPLFKIDVVSKIAKMDEVPEQADIEQLEKLYQSNEDTRLLIESMLLNGEAVTKTILDTYIPERDKLNRILTIMMKWHFVNTEKDRYYATNKLKVAFNKINKDISPITLEEKELEKVKAKNAGGLEWN
jgi:hypothetical protein